MFSPDPAQELAIHTTEGPVLIISCPGSGKTTTLVRRIHALIERGIDPRRILMVTFSRAAALEMRHKYEALYGPNPGAAFQTVHSLCLHILTAAGLYSGTDVLTEEDQHEVLFHLVLDQADQGEDLRNLTVSIAAELSALRNNHKRIADYEPLSCDEDLFRSICRSYAEWKQNHHRIDFDDLLLLSLDLLHRSAEALKYWSSRFHYIQCDEYQDINSVQRELLCLLAGTHRNLCVVGDDDQSIYRFRGARPEILLNFQKDFPDAVRILMSTNYRSSAAVVSHASRLICRNPHRFAKDFRSFRGEEGTCGRVSYIKTNGRTDEMKQLTELIQDLRKNGLPCSQMAVLFRTNKQAALPVTALTRAGIPFQTAERARSVYDGWIFRDLRIYAELSAGIWNSEEELSRKILTILNHPDRFLDPSAFRHTSYTREALLQAVAELFEDPDDWRADAAAERIETWMRDLCPGRISLDDPPEVLFDFLTSYGGIRYDHYILESAAFRKQDPASYLAEYEELRTEASAHPTLRMWFDHADRTTALLRGTGQHQDTDGVTLSTMHRAKGLEWHTVFIIDCDPYVTPHRNSLHTKEDLEEERRLFYVAMTRAKDELFILSSAKEDSVFRREAGLHTEAELQNRSSIPEPLPGQTVRHKHFGPGLVVSCGENRIRISFGGEERIFRYPDVFLKGLMEQVPASIL